jgi:hypothetical protein
MAKLASEKVACSPGAGRIMNHQALRDDLPNCGASMEPVALQFEMEDEKRVERPAPAVVAWSDNQLIFKLCRLAHV